MSARWMAKALYIISIGSFGPEATSHVRCESTVPRLKRSRSAAIAKVRRIPVYQCHLPDEFMNEVTFKSHVQPNSVLLKRCHLP